MPAFDDDELEAFYRLIESRTADGDAPCPRDSSGGVGVAGAGAVARDAPARDAPARDIPARDCPTPEKEPYSTTAEAAETIAHIAGSRYSPALRSYRCRCGAWHITSSPPRQRVPRGRRRRGRR